MHAHLQREPPPLRPHEWLSQLDLSALDAMLEVGTYRLVAIFGSLYVTGIGGINARRCLAGAALMTGSSLILLRAATADSFCSAISDFSFVILYPASMQGGLVVYRLHHGTPISPGQWVYFTGLVFMTSLWSLADVVCSGSYLGAAFTGFIVSSVLLLQVPVVDEDGATRFLIAAAVVYLLALSVMCLLIS
jgi:hypothetical protein